MKKILYILVRVILISGFFYSCQNNFDLIPKDTDFTVLHKKQPYPLNNQKDLNTYIKAVVGEDEIEITESTFEEGNDELGRFYLIKAKYNNANLINSITISLSELEALYKEKSGSRMLTTDCTMTCTPNLGCSGCKQVIITRCESQECSCPSGAMNGTCSSSIRFGGNEQ